MKIALGCDHAGYALKRRIAEHLEAAGHQIVDCGTDSEAPVDYPPFCAAAARAVVRGEADLAVVMGGSGQGEQIAANKVHGARAALCHDEWHARMARQHNDANVLSLGARVLAPEMAIIVLDVFLSTAFDGGRHVTRIDQLTQIEREEDATNGPS